MLKLKFGAIRWVVRGVVVFVMWVWDKIRHQIVYLMSLIKPLIVTLFKTYSNFSYDQIQL